MTFILVMRLCVRGRGAHCRVEFFLYTQDGTHDERLVLLRVIVIVLFDSLDWVFARVFLLIGLRVLGQSIDCPPLFSLG